MSAFLDLEAAVAAALLASPALASGHVFRGRDVPMPTGRSQQIDVSLAGSRGQIITLAASHSRWDTAIAIVLRARATAGQGGSAAVDALLVDVFGRMAAASPPEGAARWTLQPDIQWSVDEADQTLVEARLTLRVDHFTGTGLAAAT